MPHGRVMAGRQKPENGSRSLRGDGEQMTRISVFLSPLLLRIEHIERVLDRANKTAAEGYPPYNIEQTGEHRLRITLAVAGFGDEDLSVNVEDNQLVIRGKQQEDTSNRI